MTETGRTSWDLVGPDQVGWTLDRHILQRQRSIAGATGEFTGLFQQVALAAKIIASRVNMAGLAGVLGVTGSTNVQGETVQKLDEFAHRTLVRSLESGESCLLASEECADPIHLPDAQPRGKYVILFDPLDGSSNIDVNVSIGTIFSIHRRVTADTQEPALIDCLQPGCRQVAAGYVIYGSSTMFVYTTGQGVHGFTLDPAVGEFFLSHENIRIPERGKIYSINEGNRVRWDAEMNAWVDWMKEEDSATGRPYTHRYVGTLVSDFHRTLLKGGVFAYPADTKNPDGKLRLLYECAPMAMIAEAAGGAASTGRQRVLDVEPAALHQRVPLFIGSKLDVEDALRFVGRS